MNIVIGLIIFLIGVFLIVKSQAMVNIFGRLDLFSGQFGVEADPRFNYKLIGMLAIFVGILVMTNLIGGFLEWVLSPILKYSRQ